MSSDFPDPNHRNWPIEYIVDRLPRRALVAIMRAIEGSTRNQRLKEFISEQLQNLDYAQTNEDRKEIANRLIEQVKKNAGDEYERQLRGQGLFNVTVNAHSKKFKLKSLNEKTTVEEVKRIIAEWQTVDDGSFYLMYRGRILQDNTTLGDYDIRSDCAIDLTVRCRGGCLESIRRMFEC